MSYRLKQIVGATAEELWQQSGCEAVEVVGDRNVTIAESDWLNRLDHATSGQVAYARANFGNSVGIIESIKSAQASIIIVDEALRSLVQPKPDQCFVFCKDARAAFVKMARKHLEAYVPEWRTKDQLPASTIFDSGARVEAGAVIGERVKLGANCVVGASVKLGDDVYVQPGAVIGTEGFGWLRLPNGELINFPHVGGVEIGAGCTVGANSTIDRGNFGNTVVGKGTAIDSLTYIAHNAHIGSHDIICSHVTVLGNCRVGDHVRLAPGAMIRDGVKIGDRVLVGMGACVTRDVLSGKIVYGVPARVTGDTSELP